MISDDHLQYRTFNIHSNKTVTYEEALAYIASLAPRGWRLGLDRMQAFVDKIGLEDCLGAPGGPQYIHVAGTNGKGSTTAYLQSILIQSGYRTGAFFSPFVYDPRERVQFEYEYIPKHELATLTEELMPIAESFSETEFGGITEFEFKAALGFLYWKRMNCEYVALEVGLGGRLDATNVVTPKASIIVSIGLDHTNILGHTLAEIAFEKAGIIKPNVPVIVGKMEPEALEVIEKVAQHNLAPIWRYGKEITWHPCGDVKTPNGWHKGLTPGISGHMQEHNLALAVAALDAANVSTTEKGLEYGSRYASAPGRFEHLEHNGKKYILDGAHNPDAAKVLVESLKEIKNARNFILLTGMVAGHEPSDFYRELAARISSAHIVPIDFHRSLPTGDIEHALRPLISKTKSHNSVEDGIRSAEQEASGEDVILVTGSFYLVGEVGRVLKASQ